ncbi:MAG: hypothetical protein N3E40_00170 [Dehalococcoidia bacterium]|nr:hypothetical protein [Dehalococcoidia bacterium]
MSKGLAIYFTGAGGTALVCDSCGRSAIVVQFSRPQTNLCADCLRNALRVMERFWVQRPDSDDDGYPD